MIVKTQAEYNITLTEKEEEIIRDFNGVLESIIDEMTKKDCETLVWSKGGEQVNIEELKDIIDLIDLLFYVDEMF